DPPSPAKVRSIRGSRVSAATQSARQCLPHTGYSLEYEVGPPPSCGAVLPLEHLAGGSGRQTDDDAAFHLNSSVCWRLAEISLIGSRKVLPLQGRVMCVPLQLQIFAPTCAGAAAPFATKSFLYVARRCFYHADHLTCRGCGDIELASSRGFVFRHLRARSAVRSSAAWQAGLVCCGCGCLNHRAVFCDTASATGTSRCFKCSRCDNRCSWALSGLCIDTGQLACQVCCAVAAVSSRLTLAVSMRRLPPLLESNPNDCGGSGAFGRCQSCQLTVSANSMVSLY
uniref:LIM zinc-binding domain-containing protein n=1 Tax=Macrostomum lignano TaxID=282301 RepID=A0A1I8FP07_9PLAT